MSEKQPGFIREFSKKDNQEKRRELAQEIRADRTARFEKKEERNEVVAELEALNKELDTYNNASFFSKAADFLKVRATREKLGLLQRNKQELDTSLATPNAHGKQDIEVLYEQEKQRWANSEYGKEDIATQFTEEHLASLSVEDYALLMKRFPSEMVTHVTRQGVRDHTGMWEHTAGEGAFHNGFEKMLNEGALKSPLAIRLAEKGKEQAVLDLLRSRQTGELPATQAEAYALLDAYMRGGQGGYIDAASIHFAAEEVADHFYGSERGNEIFVAYPSAYIASQYHFSHGDLAPEKTGDQHNDAWVMTQEDRGLKLDAGLVFIPKDAQVDPKTGSRYEVGPDGKPIENTELSESLYRFAASPDAAGILEDIKKSTGKLYEPLPLPSTWDTEMTRQGFDSYAHKDALAALIPVRDKLTALTGIKDDRVLARLFDYRNASNFESAAARYDEGEKQHDMGYAAQLVMEQSGTRYKEASNTVPSEEYWNAYFDAHPDKKPSKVVFYAGGDPSKALYEWRRSHGLDKRSPDTSMGFAERKSMTQEAEMNSAKDRAERFRSLARSVIEENFPETAAPQQEAESDLPDDEMPPPLPPEDLPPRRPPPPPPPTFS